MSATVIRRGRRLPISAVVTTLAVCACNARDGSNAATAGAGGVGGGSSDSLAGTTNRAAGGAGGATNEKTVGTSEEAKGGAHLNGGGSNAPTGGAVEPTSSSGRGANASVDGAKSSVRDPAGGAGKTTVANGGTGGNPDSSASTAESKGGASTSAGTVAARVLCVFDYDLTLSTHACAETEGDPASLCRVADCSVYGWSDQCMAKNARAAVAECVRREAYIGIASHSLFEACWNDKVVPILTERQFPEFTDSPHYDNKSADFAYPAIDQKDNWNCEDCAYQMDTRVAKHDGIARIMRHYGMDPDNPSDRRRVLFWDDDPNNINDVVTQMPEVTSVTVQRHGDTGADGGCGITLAEMNEGWSHFP